ncbi:hypothetical protein [Burkholderia cenocepacia]|uniref:hypothetical protein n=1 Tax=Burkholderia cenocepacia TaxID=95486 RepID=UPI00406D3867
MKTFIGAATGLCQPCLRSRLLVKVRRVRLDFQELNEVFAILNADRLSRAKRFPEAVVKVDFLHQSRICLQEISTHAIDEIARFTFSECRQVRRGEIKRHKGAP